ncbi:MAG: glutathione-disulfide reductase [Micavibrio aeruginosavorus]|uniref:Glutathione-disulfide reductase n=1 Tax=Micavibrio aeruginosavorus TaxID=349221 RepID=A0A2W5HLV8_9BACT|nr:MAG: glutathione-disulfide reductase [Micavibrio aeruginosavorus]
MAYDFDYFVIGAGSGGVRSARIAASLGAKVGIAEATHFGGTCVNVGCIPKKIFSYAADYGTDMMEAGNYGWTSSPKFNWKTLKQNKDNEIARLSNIYREILNINKVSVYEGYAVFKDEHTIQIGNKEITAERILIAVGGKPQKPDVKGAEFAKTSDDMFALDELPKNIIILGAGYIALEFAHILHGIGCDITIVHRGDFLLKGFDIDLQDHLLEEMKKQGIKFVMNKQVAEITENSVICDDGEIISADLVMAATGRVPMTSGLELDKAGVEIDDRGHIITSTEHVTSKDHIYAVGDVTNSPQLTPVAIAQGHALADTLFNAKVRYTNFDLIPTAVFSKPEIGTVGLTEQQAVKKGIAHIVYKSTFRPLRHTITGLQSKVLIKLVVCANTDKVLGIHMAGSGAGELIQMAGIALNAGVTKANFDSTMPVHPTTAEEFIFLHAGATPHPPETLAKRG